VYVKTFLSVLAYFTKFLPIIYFLFRIFMAYRRPVGTLLPSSFRFNFSATYTTPNEPCPILAIT